MTWRVLLVLVVVSLADAQATLARYRELPNGPLQFAYEQCHFEPDSDWQREALIAFGDPNIPRISLQACAGPGKTAVEAICAWYFLSTQGRKHEHPKGLAFSVTAQNLRANFWSEMAKWQQRSRYLSSAFTWTSSRIFANDHAPTWFLEARAWPKTGNADEQGATLSGLHGPYVATFGDETGNIPSTVLRAAEQALSTRPKFGKILQGGNPISLEGMLYEAATKLRHQWHIISINGDPDDPRRSPRIDLQWAKDQIATYGRENPWVLSYILGKFPPTSLNALLGIDDVEAAMARHLREDQYSWAQRRLGVDVARFGDDRSVIFPRQGLAAFRPVVMRSARTTDIAARVAQAVARWGSEVQFIDDTGHWGHGVIDNLIASAIPSVGIQFHAKAINPRYKNRRVEMWLSMAEWVKSGGALPPVPELVAELITPTYTFANGVFVLEEKDQIKGRLGRSPDLADALALTFAIPDMPSEVEQRLRGQRSGHAKTDYDPYANREDAA